MQDKKTKFKPTPEMISAAETLFMAMAYTKTVGPVVKKIQQDQLNKSNYKWDIEKLGDRLDSEEWFKEHGDYCKKASDTFLMDAKDFAHYMTEINQQYNHSGFKIELNYCPFLTAEKLEGDAKKILIDVMEPLTHISYRGLIISKKWKENMNTYINLTLRLLASFVNSKTILTNLKNV